MNYQRTEISEIIVCEAIIHSDNRGFVYEAFKKESFENFIRF
jgi:dTDP-4-dehydrorhamnose 3,5-epimerase